jgi:aspartyl-tRNA synthetase
MYRRLAIRSSLVRRMHRFLDERAFLEVETPIITKSTPEGARDYLVPYRLEAGKWYALPQSPQQYKQLLMVAGIERYYQIARCFRDESSRADRQPEFSQLDIEMSFVTQEQILSLTEELTVEVIDGVIDEFGLEKAHLEPFERLTYDEAMHLYGSDKPDLRFGLRLFDLTEALGATEFGVFKNTLEGGGVIRGVVYPGGAELSRKEINALDEFCREFGAKGMAWLAVEQEAGESTIKTPHGSLIRGSVAKFFLPEELDAVVKASSAAPGDLICMIADSYAAANNVLYRLRLEIGNRKGLRDPKVLKFCWIVDFPLVEWDADAGRWSPSHHPFTMPKEEDLIYLETDPGRIRADCYDMVCNGMELASGSIRIHRSEIQARIFKLLGIDEQTQQERFGHILEAFAFARDAAHRHGEHPRGDGLPEGRRRLRPDDGRSEHHRRPAMGRVGPEAGIERGWSWGWSWPKPKPHTTRRNLRAPSCGLGISRRSS